MLFESSSECRLGQSVLRCTNSPALVAVLLTNMGVADRSMMVAVCVLLALVSAQVTFSRDWSGGKRSPPAAFDCGQFARICRQFIHELKNAMSTDKLGKHRRPGSLQAQPDTDAANVYDDK